MSEITPEHLRATGMSMLVALFNIASVSAGPLTGLAYDNLGASRMFFLAAMIAWTGLSIFIFGTLHLRKKSALRASEQSDDDDEA